MEQEKILEIFKKTGALLEGHFLLSSGLHSNVYFQCAKVLQYPEYTTELCTIIANHYAGEEIDVIVSPAMGGIIVGYEVGRLLNKKTIFTERVDNIMTLRRGFEINPEEKVLICEDVITTLKSSKEVRTVVESFGGNVIGYSSIVDRSKGLENSDVPIFSVIKISADTYNPDDCPLCKLNQPLVKPGSRKFN